MKNSNKHGDVILCPSSRSNNEGSRVFGVVGGTLEAPKVSYLKKAQSPTEYVERLAGKEVTPEEVFRFASACEEKACQHFDGQDCRLAIGLVERLPAVATDLPRCAIRRDCRWWRQEGIAACMRCSQVITDHPSPPLLH
jgi:hypothetical protein